MNSWVGLSISGCLCEKEGREREKENVVDGAGSDAGGTRGGGAVGAADSEGAPEWPCLQQRALVSESPCAKHDRHHYFHNWKACAFSLLLGFSSTSLFPCSFRDLIFYSAFQIGIYEDSDNARKDEIAALGGQTATGINVFSAFYDRLKEVAHLFFRFKTWLVFLIFFGKRDVLVVNLLVRCIQTHDFTLPPLPFNHKTNLITLIFLNF